jgi:polysaccharide chain length determinant protein (PEP-CTERM system associated)
METEEENSTKGIDDYLQILRRRKYTILASMLLFAFIGILVTLSLPPLYLSTATILIEQQKIPTDFVRSSVISSADERIMQIKQSVMTVDNINKIIDKYQLYPNKKQDILELAETFRTDFTFELLSADVISKSKGSKIALAFKLGFFHRNPLLAQKTVNEITNLFLSENIKSRTEGAIQTTAFLDEEAKQLKQRIQEAEIEIEKFKEKNNGSLPELLASNLAEVSRIGTQLEMDKSKEEVLNEQKANLQAQLSATSPFPIDTVGQSTAPESLAKLKADYAQLLAKYSPLHPDAITLKHKIDNYQETPSPTNQTDVTNPVYLNLKGQINIIEIEQKNLAQEKVNLTQSLQKLQVQLSRTPQVERELSELMRDLESSQLKYKEITAKYLEAKLSQSLEQEQKSEKFSVIESASMPSKPEKPDRIKILLMSLAVSIAAGIGIGVSIELYQNKVYGHKTLTSLTRVPLLIVIPYIKNVADIEMERKRKRRFVIFCVFLVIAMLIFIHIRYMPLNVIADKVLSKLNNI